MGRCFPIKTRNAKAFQQDKRVITFFDALVQQYQRGEEPCLFLPSLMELSKCMGCSTLDIQCALLELRKRGYDYFMMDIYAPITLWYPPRISLEPEV